MDTEEIEVIRQVAEPAPEGWIITLEDVYDDSGSWHFESILWRLASRRWPFRHRRHWRPVMYALAGSSNPLPKHHENAEAFREYIARITT